MKKILVIGSLNMDLIVKTDRLPKLGETVIGTSFYTIPGGKGQNQAVAAAKLGADIQFIGKIGKDSYGKELLENLKENKMSTDGIILSDEVTGRAVIQVDKNGNNTIVVIGGSNSALTEEDIKEKYDFLKNCNIIIMQHEIPVDTVKFIIKEGKKLGKMIILNPAPALIIEDTYLNSLDYLILNETELDFMSGTKNNNNKERIKECKNFINKGVKNIILTLGEKGGIFINKKGETEYKAYKVKAVDTTAAGDSFIGAFAVKLSEGKTEEEAVRYASAVAALTVTRMGAQKSLPDKKEVDEFFKNYKVL